MPNCALRASGCAAPQGSALGDAQMELASHPAIDPNAPVVVGFSLSGNGYVAEDVVIQAINEARSLTRLAAYSSTSKRIAVALVAARQRDVEVSVVIDPKENQRKHTAVTFIANEGVPTRLDGQYAIMHNKCDSSIAERASPSRCVRFTSLSYKGILSSERAKTYRRVPGRFVIRGEHEAGASTESIGLLRVRLARDPSRGTCGRLMSASPLQLAICATKPREKDGARTSARFAFQAHVSVSKILEWHQQGINYRAIFDYHDDLVLIETDGPNERIHFFQIKGKGTGPWSATDLCRPHGKAPQTIVGKMYFNARSFPSFTAAATFLTNAAFKFDLANGTATTSDHRKLVLKELCTKDQDKIAAGLSLDFPPPRSPAETDLLRFEITKIPHVGYETMLKGELVSICSQSSNVLGLHRTLIAEVTSKANDTTECKTIEDVFELKSISRDEIEELVCVAIARRHILDEWLSIDDDLAQMGKSIGVRINLRTQVVQYMSAVAKRAGPEWGISEFLRPIAQSMQAELQESQSVVAAVAKLGAHPEVASRKSQNQVAFEAALLVEAWDAL